MPIKKLPASNLGTLIKNSLFFEEDDETVLLSRKIINARKRGWLNKSELVEICYWKSARPINYIKANSPQKIKQHTRLAFSTRSEQQKIIELTSLKGVSIPMASSILMLANPDRYCVIDIRVWEILYELGIMKTNSKGVNFSFKEWYKLLVILRYYAKKLRVSTRTIELTLFKVHQKYQKGKLYANLASKK